MKLTYKAANGATVKINLFNAELKEVRGVWIWKGRQMIRGSLVNRSIPCEEILKLEN